MSRDAPPRRLAATRAPRARSGSADDLVDVAPAPRLAGLDAAHHRVARLVEVRLGVLADRGVAAADLPALGAGPQVHPGEALGDAPRAPLGAGRGLGCLGGREVLARAG